MSLGGALFSDAECLATLAGGAMADVSERADDASHQVPCTSMVEMSARAGGCEAPRWQGM